MTYSSLSGGDGWWSCVATEASQKRTCEQRVSSFLKEILDDQKILQSSYPQLKKDVLNPDGYINIIPTKSSNKNIDSYDEGFLELEQSSMAQPISQDNLGYQLLQKQGWSSGKGLGRTEQGRLDPLPIVMKEDIMGFGRLEMEVTFIEIFLFLEKSPLYRMLFLFSF
ncbi:UNVERIFIED_CONTAM: G patch domain-containing protein 8 [Trichonephila clavipes]